MAERGCAVCGTPKGLEPCLLSVGAATAALDLCERHSVPVLELIALGTGQPSRKALREPRKAQGHSITPVD